MWEGGVMSSDRRFIDSGLPAATTELGSGRAGDGAQPATFSHPGGRRHGCCVASACTWLC